MKQYNKIWVPEKKQGLAFRDSEGGTPSILSGPVIVLTIEELREMWFKAQNFGRDISNYHSEKSPSHNGYVDFESFMQSKGLTIKQQ